jgi:hypothetical protein
MFQRTTLVAVFVGGFFGCTCDKASGVDAGPIDAGPPVVSEKEPNDTPDKALVIERNTIVEANLGADPARPDVDWYELKSALPRTVDVRLSCPPGADVAMEIVDETGTVLQAINAGGIGAGEHLPNLDVSGKAFLRVVSMKKGAGGAYTLVARFSDRVPGYELEPNDRRVDATQVGLGQAVSGYLAHGNDVDLYRFELPSKDEDASVPLEADAGDDAGTAVAADAGAALSEPRVALRIDVSAVDAVAFDVQLMTEAEAVLFSAKSREGAGLSLRNVGVRASDKVIYVAVRSAAIGAGKDAKRGANDSQTYTLTVAQEEAGASAELEPNDDPAHATDLPANSYREGYISPKGDLDYFRLITDGPSLAKLQLSGVEKVDLVLSVVSAPDGKPEEILLRANEGGTREPEQLNNVSCDKSCFIRVEAAPRKIDGKWVREDENSDSAYRLTAIVVPDDGSEEREPNNTAATAQHLTLGKPVRGTVYPKRDVDYFLLDLKDREVKTPIRATVTGVLKVDIGLYLHRLEADNKLTLVQTSDSARGDRPETIRFSAEPGVYVLEVRDSRNREANFQDSYQLTADEDVE